MKTELNVLFKSMQRDDKKEILKFEVKGGDLPHSQALNEMVGNIVTVGVKSENWEPDEIAAEFATLQRDSKKTVIKLAVKGDNEDESIELYKLAGTNVTLTLQPSQMSIDEYYDGETHEGISGRINPDGTVDVDPDQASLFDEEGEPLPFEPEADELDEDELPE